MADNTLNIGISAQIDGLKKGLDDAKKELGGFTDGQEKAFKQAGDSSKQLTGGIQKSSKAIQEADKYTNGLASSLVDVSTAAKSAGGAMNGALLTTGIGAVVIALGLVVQHWEDIKNFIDDSNVKLQEHINQLGRARDILGGEIELNKLQEKFLKYQGKSTEDLVNARRELYANQQSANVLQLAELRIQNERLTNLSKEAGWWQILLTAQSGRIATTKAQSEEDKKAAADRIKEIQALQKAIEGVKFDVFKLDNPDASVKTFTGQVTTALSSAAATLEPVFLQFKEGFNFFDPVNIRTQVTEAQVELAKMKIFMEEFNADMSNIINNGIGNAFAGLGDAIGQGLANGASVLQSIGGALLGALGGILVQVGEMAIATGVALIGIKTALKSLNPAVAIAAGVALVALGSFVGAQSKKISSSMGGGGRRSGSGVSGSGDNNSRYRGSSASSSGGGGGTYVFEIQGTKLVGVLSNTLRRNSALGGSLQIG